MWFDVTDCDSQLRSQNSTYSLTGQYEHVLQQTNSANNRLEDQQLSYLQKYHLAQSLKYDK